MFYCNIFSIDFFFYSFVCSKRCILGKRIITHVELHFYFGNIKNWRCLFLNRLERLVQLYKLILREWLIRISLNLKTYNEIRRFLNYVNNVNMRTMWKCVPSENVNKVKCAQCENVNEVKRTKCEKVKCTQCENVNIRKKIEHVNN